jgi:hypothetical protein
MAAQAVSHSVLGQVWPVAGPAGTVLGVPVVERADDGRMVPRPLARAAMLSAGRSGAWEAHRNAHADTAPLRPLAEIRTAAGNETAPFELTFPEARLMASILQARLPSRAELLRVLDALPRNAPLDLPAGRTLRVWTTDRATCLDDLVARMAQEPGFESLADRTRVLAEQRPFLRTGERRTVTFTATGERQDGWCADSDTCALWLVCDLANASQHPAAGQGA